ncbi:MAG: NADH-quinone oxidoreductase subunit NuoE family protein [Dehalococcoidia bacterium]
MNALKTNSPKQTKLSATVRKAIGSYERDKDKLIQILLDLQSTLGWLSREVLAEVSTQLEVPLTQVYQVASYYKAFSLVARGRHTIKVCLGTACQVRGSPRLLDTISAMLGIKPSETSQDMRFTLETVNCLGCCAMGPLVVVDDVYHSKPSTLDLRRTFESAK